MTEQLSVTEMLALAGDLSHSPNCPWEDSSSVVAVMDAYGNLWTDYTLTVPYVEPPCTCGYFVHVKSGREKLRAMIKAVSC